MSSTSTHINLAIFASGSGTNAQAIMERFQNHARINVALVITNRADAGVIERAERLGVEWMLLEKSDFSDAEMIKSVFEGYAIDWVVLAGWLLLVPEYLIELYPNRMINVHPALLPKFGGKGMYGSNVHRAVHAAGEKESGITIHYVNEQFDEGKIIAQHSVSLQPSDGPNDIEQKVRELELAQYSEELEKLVLSH